MKKVLIIIAALLVTVLNVYAGHGENKRNHCRPWAKRYAANGHVATTKCGVKWNPHHDAACTYAIVHLERNWCCNSNAIAHAESNQYYLHGYYNAACSMTGYAMSDLMQDLYPEDEDETTPDIPDYTPGSQSATLNPTFGTSSVALDDIEITLMSDLNDPNQNVYTLAVWLPEDDFVNEKEDNVYHNSKAIDYGQLVLEGGELTISGTIFSATDFSVTQTNDMVTVTYIGGNKTVNIPASVTIGNLAVYSGGDIKPNEDAQMKKALSVNNGVIAGNIEFNTYPNPASNILNIIITSDKATTVKVSVYNIEGKKVLENSDIKLNSGITKTSLDIAKLSTGQYYILAEGDGIKAVKSITKQ